MAEERKILYGRDVTDLTPEQLRDFVMATEMFNTEREFESQNNLPEELRDNGIYGTLARLGRGRGDDRAEIGSYFSPEYQEKFRPEDNGRLVTHWGYNQSRSSPEADRYSAADMILKNDAFRFMDKPIAAGEGIARYYPLDQSRYSTAYRNEGIDFDTAMGGRLREMNPDSPNLQADQTEWHELTHRGIDHPAFKDFIAQFEPETTWKNSYQETIQAKKAASDAREFDTSSRREHGYIDTANRLAQAENPKRMQKWENNVGERFEYLADEFNKWMTPERREQYNVYPDIPRAERREDSWLQGIMGLLKRNR